MLRFLLLLTVGAAFGQNIALVGGTVYVDSAIEPIRDGVVVVESGRIAAVGRRGTVRVPRNMQVIDCSFGTVTAGFWNSHVHFFERKWAKAAEIAPLELEHQLVEMLTRYGFTSAFDLGSEGANTRRIRDRIESGEVMGPRIRTTGTVILPPKPGIPPETILNVLGMMNNPGIEVASAEQAATAARRLIAEGSDGVKLFASAPSGTVLADGVIAAVVKEAHQLGKPVFVHPNTRADVLVAIRGGADVIAHTTPRSAWDESVTAAIKEFHPALLPTLTIWNHYARHDRISMQEQVTSAGVAQLRTWIGAGGTVLYCSDLGAIPYLPIDEYRLMKEAGMTFRQILASLTTLPAQLFGEGSSLGRIAVGYSADLVVVQGDPESELSNLAAVAFTLRDGRVIHALR